MVNAIINLISVKRITDWDIECIYTVTVQIRHALSKWIASHCSSCILVHIMKPFWSTHLMPFEWSRKLHSGSSPTASQQLMSIHFTGLDYSSSKILSPASPPTNGGLQVLTINCFTPGLLLLVLPYLLMDTGRSKGLVHATATVLSEAILGFLKLIKSLP